MTDVFIFFSELEFRLTCGWSDIVDSLRSTDFYHILILFAQGRYFTEACSL